MFNPLDGNGLDEVLALSLNIRSFKQHLADQHWDQAEVQNRLEHVLLGRVCTLVAGSGRFCTNIDPHFKRADVESQSRGSGRSVSSIPVRGDPPPRIKRLPETLTYKIQGQ